MHKVKKVILCCLMQILVVLLTACTDPDGPIQGIVGNGGQLENQEVSLHKEYETYFHHTTTGSIDGGKSLVLCPGQNIRFDRCVTGNTVIPFHGYDKGRISYWNMRQEPRGDIVCTRDGVEHNYRADATIVYGDCN